MNETGAQPRSVEHVDLPWRLRQIRMVEGHRPRNDGAEFHRPQIRRQRGRQRFSPCEERVVEALCHPGERPLDSRVAGVVHADETVAGRSVAGVGHRGEVPIKGLMRSGRRLPQHGAQRHACTGVPQAGLLNRTDRRIVHQSQGNALMTQVYQGLGRARDGAVAGFAASAG